MSIHQFSGNGHAVKNGDEYFSEVKSRISVRDVLHSEGIDLGRDDRCICPFHEGDNGGNPSGFSLNPDDEHMKCFVCGWHGDVVSFYQKIRGFPGQYEAAKALDERFGRRPIVVKDPKPKPKPDRVHDYQDEHGNVVYRTMRRSGKWSQERYDRQTHRFVGGKGCMQGVVLYPYRLPELLLRLEEKPDEIVYVAEGERDVDTLWNLGKAATCNPMGAGKWRDEFSRWVSGRKAVVFQDDDQVGKEHAQKVAGSLHGVGCVVRVLGMPGGHHDVSDYVAAGGTWKELVAAIRETKDWDPDLGANEGKKSGDDDAKIVGVSGRKYKYDLIVNAADVEPKPIDWLWENRVPFGFLTLFAGRTGSGKSLVAVDLAARLSRGTEMPLSGGHRHDPMRTLILSEDNTERLLVPRLEAAGADRKMIDMMTIRAMAEFCLDDQTMWEDTYHAAKEPRLVIVDPPANFLKGRDENSNEQVRSMLMTLSAWAEIENVAVILITHCNKGAKKGTEALDRVIASVAWTTASRLVHLLGIHPRDDRLFLFAPCKTNLGKLDRSLSYCIREAGLSSIVHWVGYEDLKAKDVEGGDVNTRPAPRAEKALGWLKDKFREKMAWRSTELLDAAQQAGHSRNALWDVKTKGLLEIRAKPEHEEDGTKYWTWFVMPGWDQDETKPGRLDDPPLEAF